MVHVSRAIGERARVASLLLVIVTIGAAEASRLQPSSSPSPSTWPSLRLSRWLSSSTLRGGAQAFLPCLPIPIDGLSLNLGRHHSFAQEPRAASLHDSIELSESRLAILPNPRAYSVKTAGGFCEWVEGSDGERICQFWDGVVKEIEEDMGIRDYHLAILPNSEAVRKELGKPAEGAPFVIMVTHSLRSKRPGPYGGPAQRVCMTCDPSVEVSRGVWGCKGQGEEGGVLASDLHVGGGAPGVVASFDAKGRDMFVVCPSRHRERLGQLSPAETEGLWRSVAGVLREQRMPGGETLGMESVVVNHGSLRTVAHLHAKIWVTPQAFDKARSLWTPKAQRAFALIDSMAGRLGKRPQGWAQAHAPSCGHGALVVDRLPPQAEQGELFEQLLVRCHDFGHVAKLSLRPKLGSPHMVAVVEYEDQKAASHALESFHMSPLGASRRLRCVWAEPCECDEDGECGEESLVG
uniref:RRM domain-containing protein n=1 Tax=Hemiselmis andersenii TaxID=464988 RepID=A0A7S1E1I6_HEMAN